MICDKGILCLFMTSMKLLLKLPSIFHPGWLNVLIMLTCNFYCRIISHALCELILNLGLVSDLTSCIEKLKKKSQSPAIQTKRKN